MAIDFGQTASTTEDLLKDIYAFAVGDGWTGVYSSNNTTVDRWQIGLEKLSAGEGCAIAMGEENGSPYSHYQNIDEYTAYDGVIAAALSGDVTSKGSPNEEYWGHDDSLVTAGGTGSGSYDRVRWNDVYAAPSIWFFSNAGGEVDYVHTIVQNGSRFSHMSFGVVNQLGMSAPTVSYCVALYWEWWQNRDDPADSAYTPNDVSENEHMLGFNFNQNYNVRAEGGVLPSGFPSYPSSVVAGHYTEDYMMRIWSGSLTKNWGHTSHGYDNYLEGLVTPGMQTMPTTGGTPLWALPVLFASDEEGGSSTTHVMLGVLPDVRMVSDGRAYNPGDEIEYGDDEWVVFPLKRFGLNANAAGGASPQKENNSINYALAYKKNE